MCPSKQSHFDLLWFVFVFKTKDVLSLNKDVLYIVTYILSVKKELYILILLSL